MAARVRVPRFRRVVIAGVGLMGGSLGMALKQRGLARRVVGWVRRPEVIPQAKRVGAIDQGTRSLSEAVAQADLVVLCGPISTSLPWLKAMLPHLAPGCLITDVGSTKSQLMRSAQRLLTRRPDLNFIGSHPMAGSERTGVAAARPDLYQGALCFLTPGPSTPPAARRQLEALWRGVGCQPVLSVTPAAHDRWTAGASHLPHTVAVALVSWLAERSAREPGMLRAAATGFRDTTRIAASSPEVWRDILLTNAREVKAALRGFQRHLDRLLHLIDPPQAEALVRALAKASAFRRKLGELPRARH